MHGIDSLVHLSSGEGPISGHAVEEDCISSGQAILIENGLVCKISGEEELVDEYQSSSATFVDVNGRSVIPGLVDAHTHLLWQGDRSNEVRLRMEGMSYSQIANRGGGIAATVDPTRKADIPQLVATGRGRLLRALKNGTTHLEVKSGYGLSTASELRLLEAAHILANLETTPTIDSTWLGAHAIPPGGTKIDYMEELISEQLPSVIEQGLARSVDVFCEPGWFTVEETELICKEASSKGLDIRLHIDEFCDGGGGNLAADLNATTADHAHYTPLDSRKRMAKTGVMTGFLPGTPYSMGENWPDFNQMCREEIPWSAATDFNPNCNTISLPFIGSILVQRCKVNPLDALVAITRNPATTTPHPAGVEHGMIKEGAAANLNVVDSKHWEKWALTPGETPFWKTVLNGEIIDF